MIKKYGFGLVAMLILFSMNLYSQTTKLPSVDVKDLSRSTVNTSTFSNDGKPFAVCFWATWCKPCIEEMKTYNELYEKWQKETGIKIYSISIDDSRSSKKVPQFVKGRNWGFDVYLDENSDFRRAMNVNNPPHTFLFNGKGELVWQHVGFAQGDEDTFYEEIKKAAAQNAETK